MLMTCGERQLMSENWVKIPTLRMPDGWMTTVPRFSCWKLEQKEDLNARAFSFLSQILAGTTCPATEDVDPGVTRCR